MNKKSNFDIIVIGGGISGLICSLALEQAGFIVALVEKKKLAPISKDDIRSLAIAPSSADFLRKIDIWQALEPVAGQIHNIRVLDNHSPFFLDFEEKDHSGQAIGYIIEAYKVHNHLIDEVLKNRRIVIFDSCEVVSYEDSDKKNAVVKLSSGNQLTASLVIAADGKFSKMRELLGIKSFVYDYNQTVMVTFCKHQRKHENWAIEHFMPSGPFAILPLNDPNRSGIVWTEKPKLAAEYCKMSKHNLEHFLNKKFTDYLGEVKLDGKISSYPLSLQFSTKYYSGRFVLVGDAAHTIHPLAGQGLNLSIRDIKLLVELLSRNFHLGLDIGDEVVLAEYQRTRLLDNSLMLLITHGLDTLFSNDYTLLKPVRKLGLSIVNKMTKLKGFFMTKAMGKNYKDLK